MGIKVVISFSGGKDSMLSLHKAISQGYEPIALMTTINKNKGDSWFHDISSDLLKQVSSATNIPLLLVECDGENYEKTFEAALKNMKNLGAEACVFGDIDIDHHKQWGENRCKNVGIKAIFPLWQNERELLVKQFIDLGYKAIIKKVNLQNMDSNFLGKTLTHDLLNDIKKTGSDVCGENGEYHTFVYDGPIFSKKIKLLENREIINENTLVLRLH
ncbi:diphthine--ammonia ligase [Cetobacterium somerae]|uniref:Dph6-related ATP pyrophosphatase n=1 Tax=Cetobacterium sp. NK01 TaxID=2993530 RepID=UPI002116562F|nr:diphthine--ammonia ligase [Cetobacterium sp. NK01]MCQ8213067.1 diphthine--ammonia ligase [Cetobacterium sp. NK01]